MENILTMPRAAQIITAASALALAGAFVLQYGFGVEPCILCLWQRVPYGATLVLAILAWGFQKHPKTAAGLLFLCAVSYLTGLGLAIFHSGVELHWWLGTSGCSVHPATGSTPEDLRAVLLDTSVARCDQITWTLFGLSLANYNIAGSLILAFFTTAAAAKVWAGTKIRPFKPIAK